jgi:hypothetical protein
MRHNASALAGLAAVAVLLTGCGGSSDPDAVTGPTPPAAGVPATAKPDSGDHSSPQARAATPTAGTSAADGGEAPTSEGDGTDADDGSGAGSAADSSGQETDAGSSSFPLVEPGHYTYRAHGHAETALGDRDFDGKSRLTVTAPSDNRRHATLSGEDGTTEQTLVGRRSGLYLAELKMTQQGFDADFRPRSPVLLFPAGAKVGDHWSWQMRSTDGDYTLHATLRLADDDGTATVSGRQVQTVTVKGTLVLDGDDFSMTLHQTDEAAVGGLVVHEHTTGDGTAYGTPVHTEADRRLL